MHFITIKLRMFHSCLSPGFSHCLYLFQCFPLFYNITPGRYYLCLCFCSLSLPQRAVRVLAIVCHLSFNESSWCTFFPHLDKEQFNEIYVLFLVRGQWLISELAVYWPLPLTCFVFTACWHTSVKLRAKYVMMCQWFHTWIFTHKYFYACSRLSESYLISSVHQYVDMKC